MENITISSFVDLDGVEYEQVIIDNGNGSFTSMLKSTYEAQQKEQSTPLGVE